MNSSRQFTYARPKGGIIGHRGVAALAPENTLSSFKLAYELGIDTIEFDIRLTKDNQLVIFHDDTLERTTNGQGTIEEIPFSDLMKLDAGTWFHSRFEGERIPLFEQALVELFNLPLSLNIELKLMDNPTVQQIQSFAECFTRILKNRWPLNRSWPLVSSFHWPILHLVRSQFPFIPLGFLTEKCTMETVHTIAQTQNAALHTHFQCLTPEILGLAQSMQLPILAYTVNETSMASQLFDANVFAIFSDKPLFMVPSP